MRGGLFFEEIPLTTVNINLQDVANFAPSQGDSVVFEAPTVRGAASGAVISTAQHSVRLTNGVGSVQLEPGPVLVTINARNYRGQRQFRGVVPGSGSVSLLRVIEGEFEYEPAVMAEVTSLLIQAQQAQSGAAASAKQAGVSQSQAAASAAAAKASESAAGGSAAAAKASEATAVSKAADASGAAVAAKASEAAAAAKASEASGSASAAKSSEANAKASEVAAGESVSAASGSAAAAKSSEVSAKNSADAAAASATSLSKSVSATANSVVQRDGEGRTQVADPSVALDVVNKQFADKTYAAKSHTHLSADIADAVSAPSAGKVVEYDSSGFFTVNAPTAASHAATKNYVDTGLATKAASSHTHPTAQISDATSSIGTTAAGNRVVKTDANGKVSVPTASITAQTDVANKEYVDQATTGIASAGHKHTSADITDAATSAVKGKLVKWDDNGLFTVFDPKMDGHPATKRYVDSKKWGAAAIEGSESTWDIGRGSSYSGKIVKTYSDGNLFSYADNSANSLTVMPKKYIDERAGKLSFISYPDQWRKGSSITTDGAGNFVFDNGSTDGSNNRLVTDIVPFQNGRTYRMTVVSSGTGRVQAGFYLNAGSEYSESVWPSNQYKDVTGIAVHSVDTKINYNSAKNQDGAQGTIYLFGSVTILSVTITDVTDYATQYLTTEDLNTVVDEGVYHQPTNAQAEASANYPAAVAGWLEVYNPTHSNMIYQRYTSFNNTGMWVRRKYNSGWYNWQRVTFDGHKHVSADITDAKNGYTLTSVGGNGGKLVQISGNGTLEVHADNLTRGNSNAVTNKEYVDAQDAKQLTATEVEAASAMTAGKVVRRQSNSNIQVPATPAAAGDAASKAYVDAQVGTRVETSSVEPPRDGLPPVAGDEGGQIPLRQAMGNIRVPSRPSGENAATSKAYVDTQDQLWSLDTLKQADSAIAKAIEKALKVSAGEVVDTGGKGGQIIWEKQGRVMCCTLLNAQPGSQFRFPAGMRPRFDVKFAVSSAGTGSGSILFSGVGTLYANGDVYFNRTGPDMCGSFAFITAN